MSGNYVPPTYLVTDGNGHVLGWLKCICGMGKEGTNPDCHCCAFTDPYDPYMKPIVEELREKRLAALKEAK